VNRRHLLLPVGVLAAGAGVVLTLQPGLVPGPRVTTGFVLGVWVVGLLGAGVAVVARLTGDGGVTGRLPTAGERPAYRVPGDGLAGRTAAVGASESDAAERDPPVIHRTGHETDPLPESDESYTSGEGSSLASDQDRVLHLRGTCTLCENGEKHVEVELFSPIGTVFEFRSDEPEGYGGQGRAPDAMTYVAAGIGFCFMTQMGRYADTVVVGDLLHDEGVDAVTETVDGAKDA